MKADAVLSDLLAHLADEYGVTASGRITHERARVTFTITLDDVDEAAEAPSPGPRHRVDGTGQVWVADLDRVVAEPRTRAEELAAQARAALEREDRP